MIGRYLNIIYVPHEITYSKLGCIAMVWYDMLYVYIMIMVVIMNESDEMYIIEEKNKEKMGSKYDMISRMVWFLHLHWSHPFQDGAQWPLCAGCFGWCSAADSDSLEASSGLVGIQIFICFSFVFVHFSMILTTWYTCDFTFWLAFINLW